MIWFISDAHITEQMYVHRPLIKGDSYRAIDSIVDKILEKKVNGSVIFCGDNFNSNRPSAKDVMRMSDATHRLEQQGIAVYGIQGNHDLSRISWMDLCDVRSINDELVNIEGKQVYGLDYIPGARIFDELDRINREVECDLLVLHQPFAHLNPFDSYSLDVEDIPGSVKEAVISGHIHIPDKRVNSLGISVVSPGATHPRSISEPAGTYVQYNDKDFLHITTPSSRPIHRFKLRDKESCDAIKADLDKLAYFKEKDVDEWPLVEIKYLVDASSRLEELDTYADRSHMFLKSESDVSLDQEDIEIDINTSKEEILEQCIEKDSDEFTTILEMLSGNPEKIIEDMDTQFQLKLKELKDEIKELKVT